MAREARGACKGIGRRGLMLHKSMESVGYIRKGERNQMLLYIEDTCYYANDLRQHVREIESRLQKRD